MLVRWIRALGWVLAGLIGFALLVPLLAAALMDEQRAAPPALPVESGSYRVAVVDWGYHTALVVEQPPGARLGPPGEEGARFVEFAWGDRAFYHAADYRPHALFATVALPTASAVFADGVRWNGFARARAVYERDVDAETLGRLLGAVEASFGRDGSGRRAAPFPRTAGTRGRFFPSPGRYLWTRSCNWWTVRRLQDAGLATSSGGVVFSGQVGGRLVGFRPRVEPEAPIQP